MDFFDGGLKLVKFLAKVQLSIEAVANSRAGYYCKNQRFSKRSQYINIKFPHHKQSGKPAECYWTSSATIQTQKCHGILWMQWILYSLNKHSATFIDFWKKVNHIFEKWFLSTDSSRKWIKFGWKKFKNIFNWKIDQKNLEDSWWKNYFKTYNLTFIINVHKIQ